MVTQIIEVNNKKLLKQFIDFPHSLYEDDPYYVPELFIAQRDLLTPGKNPFFETGRMQLFLAVNGGKIVGRIAAIYNAVYIKTFEKNDGFFGFFDCIDDQQIADLLLNKATAWLKAQGLTGKMIGPANPTSNDTWGLLIDGFDRPPMISMTYNYPYYQSLIEHYGMTKQLDLFAYIYQKEEANDQKVNRVMGYLQERLKKKGIVIRPIDLKHNFKEEVERIREVYNKAWDKNMGSVPLTENEFNYLAKDLKMVVDPAFCRVAELDGKIIGICISIPNINEILIKIKRGRLFPTGIFKLLLLKKKISSFRIMILGVLEEYRKLGIEACFYSELIKSANANPYIHEVEASWILEQNLLMNKAIQDLNGKLYKTYRVYEKPLA